MGRTVSKPPRSLKSGNCPKGNQKISRAVEIHPVMRRVRDRLIANGEPNIAKKLNYLTDQSRSICEKTLAGSRLPNAAMIESLFDSELIIDAILGLIPQASNHPKVRAVRSVIRRLELDFEDAEDGR